jgi:hypothetical protein
LKTHTFYKYKISLPLYLTPETHMIRSVHNICFVALLATTFFQTGLGDDNPIAETCIQQVCAQCPPECKSIQVGRLPGNLPANDTTWVTQSCTCYGGCEDQPCQLAQNNDTESVVGNALNTAADATASGLSTAATATKNGLETAANATMSGLQTASNAVGNAFNAVGNALG